MKYTCFLLECLSQVQIPFNGTCVVILTSVYPGVYLVYVYVHAHVDECTQHVCAQPEGDVGCLSLIHLYLIFKTVSYSTKSSVSGLASQTLSFFFFLFFFKGISLTFSVSPTLRLEMHTIIALFLCGVLGNLFTDSCLPRLFFPFLSFSRKGTPLKNSFQKVTCKLCGI